MVLNGIFIFLIKLNNLLLKNQKYKKNQIKIL